MEFEFGIDEKKDVSTGKKHIKPYTISNVAYKGAEIADVKAQNGKEFKQLILHFESEEDGVFEPHEFIPDVNNREDITERESQYGKMPSNANQYKSRLVNIVKALSEEGFTAFQTAAGKLKKGSTFIDFTNLFIKVGEKYLMDKTADIKVVGRTTQDGRVFAQFPMAMKRGSDGTFYHARFIGDGLTFTSAEKVKADAYHNAKPTTNPATADVLTGAVEAPEEDNSIGDLLNDL